MSPQQPTNKVSGALAAFKLLFRVSPVLGGITSFALKLFSTSPTTNTTQGCAVISCDSGVRSEGTLIQSAHIAILLTKTRPTF